MNRALESEVNKLFANAAKNSARTLGCVFTAGGADYAPSKILSLHENGDYLTGYGDTLMMECVFPLGTWQYRIVPFQSEIVVTLQRKAVDPVTAYRTHASESPSRQYRAILSESTNHLVEGKYLTASSEDSSNLTALITVHVQLIDLALERMRLKLVGGIFRYVRPEELIRTLLTKCSSNLAVNADTAVKGAKIVEADNQERQIHIAIPHETKLYNLVKHVQETACGLYNTGAAAYYRNGYWYVYPKYHSRQAQSTPHTLTVLRVPQNRYPSVERTYSVVNDAVTILATTIAKHTDNVDALELNGGNGVRFVNANNVIGGFSKTAGNQSAISRGLNVTEIATSPRPTGINNAPFSRRAITANPYHEYSKVSSRQGTLLTIGWENSNVEVLYPGMPVIVVYVDGTLLSRVEGVLVGVDEHTVLDGGGVTSMKHTANAVLSIFLKS